MRCHGCAREARRRACSSVAPDNKEILAKYYAKHRGSSSTDAEDLVVRLIRPLVHTDLGEEREEVRVHVRDRHVDQGPRARRAKSPQKAQRRASISRQSSKELAPCAAHRRMFFCDSFAGSLWSLWRRLSSARSRVEAPVSHVRAPTTPVSSFCAL